MNTQISSFVSQIVKTYSKFDRTIHEYVIYPHYLPDFVRSELASMLISEDEWLVSESTGPDNPAFDKSMLPTLVRFLSNTSDKDREIEFVNAWRDGVTEYSNSRIEKLLDDAVSDLNTEWDRDIYAGRDACIYG